MWLWLKMIDKTSAGGKQKLVELSKQVADAVANIVQTAEMLQGQNFVSALRL